MSVGRGNRNVRTKVYKDRLEHLGDRIAKLAEDAFGVFLKDPESPILNNHPLHDTHRGQHRNGSRAVSVTLRYRAIYVVDGDVNVWYWIGTHEDYNNFTGCK
jgi:hypothetical protein